MHLLEKGDYTWALFIGHLVIEKVTVQCDLARPHCERLHYYLLEQ